MTDTGELTREAALRAAQEADAGDSAVTKQDPPTERTAEPEKATKPEADKETEQPDRKPDTDLAKKGKEDSRYAKARKDAERFDRNWKKFQEERDAFKREREQFERQRAEQTQAITDAIGYTPEDYETIAAEFEAEGNNDLAKQARSKAKAVREQRAQAEVAQLQAKLSQQWDQNLVTVARDNPDLKDTTSELYTKVKGLLKARPILHTYAEGIVDAVEAAKAYIAGSRAADLQKETENLRKEVEQLRSKLEVSGTPSAEAVQVNKSFDSMSIKEQREAILQQARALDDSGQGLFGQ